ncbi:MAG TPA: hypothetical protein PLA97_09500 [Rubrivivax sp.]|nr:hypothetical protein [Rubrivivax sp.]
MSRRTSARDCPKCNTASAPDGGASFRIDPYLIWRLLNPSKIAGQEQTASEDANQAKPTIYDWMHVLVQTKTPDVQSLLDLGFVPTHLHATGLGKSRPVCFVSGLVDKESFGKLLRASLSPDSKVLRVELAEARNRPLNSLIQELERKLSSDEVPRNATATSSWLKSNTITPQVTVCSTPISSCGSKEPLVCVIDDRFNSFNGAFDASLLKAGSTTMWHQGGDEETLCLMSGDAWDPGFQIGTAPNPFSPVPVPIPIRGALLGRRPKPIQNLRVTQGPGDQAMSAYFAQRVQWPPPSVSHGSAILDLIEGTTLWAGRRQGDPEGVIRPVTTRRRPQRLHLVQLPIPTIVDTAGGSLAATVLDGIHDALDQAVHGQPVIVNISFGTHSGGHDGTSMLEGAICELLNLYDGSEAAQGKTLHVVLPVGNSHGLLCHASGYCHPGQGATPAQAKKLLWKVQPDTPNDCFMELWLPEKGALRIELHGPDGTAPISVDFEESRGVGDPISGAAAVLTIPKPTQGLNGRMALLVIRATANTPDPKNVSIQLASEVLTKIFSVQATVPTTVVDGLSKSPSTRPVLAPHGVWTVKLTAIGTECVPFHAWIMRNDTAPMRGRATRGYTGRQSYFLDTREDPANGVDPAFTINGIATFAHERLFVVGSMRQSDHCLSHYSAAGPGRGDPYRVEGPDMVVHADASRALPGLLVAGFHGGARYRASGTSMAAAVLTRHLFEHLACGKTAASFTQRPYMDDWCMPVSFDRACADFLPVEAPLEAHAMQRGAYQRWVPCKEDGSL